jgi:hypothetical protein
VAGPRLTKRRHSAAASESGDRGTKARTGGRRVRVLLPRNHAPAKPGPGRSWRHRSVARPVARSRPRALRRRHRSVRYRPPVLLSPSARRLSALAATYQFVRLSPCTDRFTRVPDRAGACAPSGRAARGRLRWAGSGRGGISVDISSCEQGARRRVVEAHASVQALGAWSSC